MTEPNKLLQDIASLREALRRTNDDATRIRADLASRAEAAGARSAEVEVRQAALREAKLRHVLTPTKETSALLAEAQKQAKLAYGAESDDLQDEEVYRAALARLDADATRIAKEIGLTERDLILARVRSPEADAERSAQLHAVLAGYLLEADPSAATAGLDWPFFLGHRIRPSEVRERAAAIRARVLAGEAL